ncbi:MAG TPA: Fe-S oxidoreductase, partial [Cyclobacteriaceae bacterium]|nr:Fe-S oxidoreductase [Cyclobacteriaceae bacterium]
MSLIPQLVFLFVVGTATYFIRKRVLRIKANIRLGKANSISDRGSERLRNVLLVAFGQKKMFKRLVPAILHFCIYAGFLIINLEVLEFIIDGVAGTHRIFAPYLGNLYNILMNGFEFLAVAVLFACIAFLIRRNIIRVPRFWSAEMTRWPRLDGNLILCIEIILMFAIFTMNATDQILQTRTDHYISTGTLMISASLTGLFESLDTTTLIFVERFAWWFHIIGILGFTLYIT